MWGWNGLGTQSGANCDPEVGAVGGLRGSFLVGKQRLEFRLRDKQITVVGEGPL